MVTSDICIILLSDQFLTRENYVKITSLDELTNVIWDIL